MTGRKLPSSVSGVGQHTGRLPACRAFRRASRWCGRLLLCAASVVAFSVVSVGNAAGMGWSIEPAPALPAPGPGIWGGLSEVACSSRIACTAVGYAGAAQWNGRTWSVSVAAPALAEPPPSTAPAAFFYSVSCSSATACVAVGGSSDYGDRTFAERWNGSSWSVITRDAPGPFTDVSCPSSRMCLAVGSNLDVLGSASLRTLAVAHVWTGTTWRPAPIEWPFGSADTSLSSVSCSSARACTAVGWFDTGSGCSYEGDPCEAGPLIERWNGRGWSIQTASDVFRGVGLGSVSCPSSMSCFATGWIDTGRASVPFAARWDGHVWSTQPTPRRPIASSYNPNSPTIFASRDLSCTSSRTCTAVWEFTDGGVPRPFAEHWNGNRWTIKKLPIPAGAQSAAVTGLSCTSAVSCMAVGWDVAGGLAVPLVARSF